MQPPPVGLRLRHFLFGKPRDLSDHSVFHRLSLIPFLAWVGLGADGLSSSAYGPEEAFRSLGEHKYLAVPLVFVMASTVFIISAAYRRIIEDFPGGGGGYLVASKLLGSKVGLISGCALVVDYVLTITVSIAAAGDALFSLLPLQYHYLKLPVEILLIISLTTLNIRGAKESVLILTPIFITFVVTHFLAIVWGVVSHITLLPETVHSVTTGFREGVQSLGVFALIKLFIHAYALGGGTYTGIEAVSNGLPIMREPKVETAKRTMTYMATSLALTASGLLLCYLLWQLVPVPGKTMNAVLLEHLSSGFKFGALFVLISLLAEGLLLVVAAQAGFIDGPRVLANMAVDSWVPRRFASLSERLTTANGILLMGFASLVALLYTHGNVSHLVVMYSINVFLTFSLSTLGMLKSYLKSGIDRSRRQSGIVLFATSFALCASILVITVLEKFKEGGYITVAVTGAVVVLCLLTKKHYLNVAKTLARLYPRPSDLPRPFPGREMEIAATEPTAVILVGGYGGLGIQTIQSIMATFPQVYRNFVFASVGVVDSGGFKGEEAVVQLQAETAAMLARYVEYGSSLGVATTSRLAIGTDVIAEGAKLCINIAAEFPKATFFTGKIVFEKERWYHRVLHNETGLALQKRLLLAGLTMVILPTKAA